MFAFVPVLSTVLPIIASTLVFVVLSANLYFKIRRKFPTSVNCWFCNSWCKVGYDNRNSFDCPHCMQYNGFTKDGSYNKIIPEQHDELMNKSNRVKLNTTTATNGLCVLCNNNQKLKIFQLANFVPLDDNNYDIEIEHFQKQLETAYKLCKKCDHVLKRTLDKQNAWVFGNHIKNKCTKTFTKLSNQLKQETAKLPFVSKLDTILSLLLVVSVIVVSILSAKVITKTVVTYVPKPYLSIYRHVVSVVNTSRSVHLNLGSNFTKTIKFEPYLALCSIGFMFQFVRVVRKRFSTATSLNQLLCWIILLLSSWGRASKTYSILVACLEAFCCFYLLFTTFSNDDTETRVEKSRKSMRKVVKNLEYTCTDLSDGSDFEDVSCTISSGNSSGSFNKSHVPTLHTASNVFRSANCDLHQSLNNLHLGGFKPPKSTSSVASFGLKRPKPVLSPPKFHTLNSWVAGGFWREGEGFTMPKCNLSRSSSESSGFGSQHNENPFARNNYECDEYLRLCPSPAFVFATRGGFPRYHDLYHRNNSFENWSDRVNAQAMQSLRGLSLQGSN